MLEKHYLTEQQKEVAKELLVILDELPNLNMGRFTDYDHDVVPEDEVCNTSFCLAGWQAYKNGYPKKYLMRCGDFAYADYSKDLVGGFVSAWDYFYSEYWPSDIDLARWKLEWALDLGYIVSLGEKPTVKIYEKLFRLGNAPTASAIAKLKGTGK